ncbi:MAG: GNAT family N-acetyltransferase [Ginsengibacter sp.]
MSINCNPFPVINTMRLLLRQMNLNDIDQIFLLRSDPRVLHYLGRAPESSRETAKKYLHDIRELENNGEAITWGITVEKSNKVVGTICYWHLQPLHQRAEIGYALHPDHQGKGYMEEAMKAVLDYGFNTLHFHSIEADVDPNNLASIKLLLRNRFVKEAHFRENYFYNGNFFDTAVYTLLNPGE